MTSHDNGVAGIREQFPALLRHERNGAIAYLDNASSTQKPRAVLDAERNFYLSSYANVHRGVYGLAQDADAAYEEARAVTQRFLNAQSSAEIVFTAGTTASLNLVAHGWGLDHLKRGDEVVLTLMEHHANIVPWRVVADRTGAVIKVIRLAEDGSLDMEHARELVGDRTKVLAFTHVSNVLGTENPVAELCALARSVGAISVVDGAQAVAHQRVDVRSLGCDFYAFGAHKVFGPTGVGVLFARMEHLKRMSPFMVGGGMIDSVTFERITFADPPTRFEAGTPPIAQVVGLAAALEWLSAMGIEGVHNRLEFLGAELDLAVGALPGVKIYGRAERKGPVCAFSVDGIHPHDLATVLGSEGVCVRAGHHCCMPLMEHFKVPALSRASLAVYNTEAEISALSDGIRKAQRLFRC
jgi:cysteine desulfurase/selenocysteine lyase